MEEYLVVSCNFRLPVDVLVAGQRVAGLVEQLDDEDRVLIGGQWYPIEEVKHV